MGPLLILIHCGTRSVAKNSLSEYLQPLWLGGGFLVAAGCYDGFLAMGRGWAGPGPSPSMLTVGLVLGDWFLGGQVCRAESHQVPEVHLNSYFYLGDAPCLQLSPAPRTPSWGGTEVSSSSPHKSRGGTWLMLN